MIPATTAERRQAADWLRAELKIGAVPSWRVDAMLARHWRSGRSPATIKHMVCQRPDGTPHGELPLGAGRTDAVRRSPKADATVADVLLGCVGYRLKLWHEAPAEPTPRVVRPAEPTAPVLTGQDRSSAYARASAEWKAIAQARASAKAAGRM